MESRLGNDFGDVRVHTDERAAASAAAVQAHAYTVGQHVVMGSGRYQPGSSSGLRLLSHELVHTIQQRGSTSGSMSRLGLGEANDPAEREAERAAAAAVDGAGSDTLNPLDGLSGAVPRHSGPGATIGHLRRDVSVQRECIEDGAGNKRWKYEYDGCSLPAQAAIGVGDLWLGGASKDNPAGGDNTAFALMKPTTEGGVACDRHDECYQSCSTKKEQCDLRMYDDMKEACATASPTFRLKCYSAALAYYQGLKRLPQAKKAFDDRKKQVCSCEPTLLPPGERYPPLERLRTRSGRYLSWLDYQLSLGRFAGYKVFASQAPYEKYISGQPRR